MNRYLVELFVDGSSVDFAEMLRRGLIEKQTFGYVLSRKGKSFLFS